MDSTGIPVMNRDSGKDEYQTNVAAFMDDMVIVVALRY